MQRSQAKAKWSNVPSRYGKEAKGTDKVDSIIQRDNGYCYLCGASDQPLDCHHVFAGANRKKSEKYGLKVYLCHDRCHIFGANAVHMNRDVDLDLKDKVQRIAMEQYNWTLEDWRKLFGKNYLKED